MSPTMPTRRSPSQPLQSSRWELAGSSSSAPRGGDLLLRPRLPRDGHGRSSGSGDGAAGRPPHCGGGGHRCSSGGSDEQKVPPDAMDCGVRIDGGDCPAGALRPGVSPDDKITTVSDVRSTRGGSSMICESREQGGGAGGTSVVCLVGTLSDKARTQQGISRHAPCHTLMWVLQDLIIYNFSWYQPTTDV